MPLCCSTSSCGSPLPTQELSLGAGGVGFGLFQSPQMMLSSGRAEKHWGQNSGDVPPRSLATVCRSTSQGPNSTSTSSELVRACPPVHSPLCRSSTAWGHEDLRVPSRGHPDLSFCSSVAQIWRLLPPE